jgi:enoyl-CoA hydratase
VVPADQLLATARVVAQQLSQLNMTAHTQTKRKARKALLDTLSASIEVDKRTGLN